MYCTYIRNHISRDANRACLYALNRLESCSVDLMFVKRLPLSLVEHGRSGIRLKARTEQQRKTRQKTSLWELGSAEARVDTYRLVRLPSIGPTSNIRHYLVRCSKLERLLVEKSTPKRCCAVQRVWCHHGGAGRWGAWIRTGRLHRMTRERAGQVVSKRF
jgi:hypothetical protein